MDKVKETFDSKGRKIHYGVGAVIRNENGEYLLIDRAVEPYGYGCISGHIHEGEKPEEALIREVEEESGLKVVKHKLILEKVFKKRKCFLGDIDHYGYIFVCEVNGKIKPNPEEVKSIGWYTKEEIDMLKLEPVWKEFFNNMETI